MPLSKIQAESMNLADTYSFTGTVSGAGGGKVGQLIQTVKKNTFSGSPSSFSDITGMSVSITPSATSSKILVTAQISYGGSQNTYGHIRILRDSTSICVGDAGESSQTRATFPTSTSSEPDQYKCYNAVLEHLDSPSSTSSLTYKLQLYVHGDPVVYINRPENNNNVDYIGRYTSSITVMEILA